MTYSVVLADPPWKYNDYAAAPGQIHNRARGAAKHYPVMTLEQIQELPVSDFADGQCALFMWATWPLIDQALCLISSWGFTYKTLAWEWVKTNRKSAGLFMGMGRYTRSNPEPCLLAFRGKPLKVTSHSVLSVLMAPVASHSRKPTEQYERIERLYPDQRYLELFARHKQPGWDVWGNEVNCDIDLGVVK